MTPPSTRYVIVGAGAVGVTLAAELDRAGRDVVLVGRGRQLELLRAGRVRYLRPDEMRDVTVAAAGHPDEVVLRRGDVLVLATKTQHAEAALSEWAWRPVDGSSRPAAEVLPVLTLQNGLDAERVALRRFRHVIGGVLLIPAGYVTNGEVVSPAAPAVGALYLGEHPDAEASPATRRIAADLRAARFHVVVVDDLRRWKTAKLVASATFVLDALYRPGPERDRAARLVQAETRSVLAAAGERPAHFPPDVVERISVHPIPGHDRGGSSTWQSLARTGDVETDFTNGEVVLLARGLGERAPLNAALTARVHRAAREGTPPGSLDAHDLADTLAAETVVRADELADELESPRPPLLLDVRWALGDPDGEKHYLDGHLPGAVYADLETELAAPATPEGGRHPLPTIGALQAAARTWGLRHGQAVVVYDDNGGQSAARAWWLLRWAGVRDVRLLDGGLSAWSRSGGPLETGRVQPPPGDVVLAAGGLPSIDADTAGTWPEHGTLIDARAAERYRGESEPVDPRAGHIPGAVNVPTAGNLTADGRFLPVPQLRERLGAVTKDATDVAVYCGSGVTAAHEIVALRLAGIDAALFPGSWSAWSADAGRRAAVGPQPGATTSTEPAPKDAS